MWNNNQRISRSTNEKKKISDKIVQVPASMAKLLAWLKTRPAASGDTWGDWDEEVEDESPGSVKPKKNSKF